MNSEIAIGTPEFTQYKPPVIPSKYDVVPIHNSDRASFKRCRRYFDWTSPARNNLTVRADVNGINPNLWFGTGIHYALEQYYNPGLRHDPVEAWLTWYNVQWRGGTVTSEWLPLVYDLNPRPTGEYVGQATGDFSLGTFKPEEGYSPLWVVRGLEDILPDADGDEFDLLRELGVQMLRFYKTYAEMNDGFDVIVAEHDFSVPIWDYEHNRILKAIDLREQSPNYGNLLEVHARGRMDAITAKPSGKMGVMDHKTAGKFDDDIEEKLESDEQVTTYLWAGEVEANYYGLDYAGRPMEECIYNVLRKAYPKPPTVVRGGLFSVNRIEESCTYEVLMEWIKANEVDPESLSEKHKEYINYLEEIGDDQFIRRFNVRRNRHQIANAGRRIYEEAMDMLSPNLRIYPNLSNDFRCLGCAFRAPCLCKEDGSDWEQLLADNYVNNRDR